jgi:AraC-like DNA-binding protein
MTYISHIPSPPLNSYIYDLYHIDGPAPYRRLKVLPMPTLHLMINFGPAFQVYELDQVHPFATWTESWSTGLWSKCRIIAWPPNVRFFGIHFKPAGAYPFLQLPLSELHNQAVSLDAIWGQHAVEIRERLYAAPTIQAGFALFEQLLLDRLCHAPSGLDIVQDAIREIARHHGALSIRELSDHIGISQNHLGTHFKRIVGVAPKELARFYRFVHVLRSVDPSQPVDLALLAHECDFYDQSHFNKEFIAFTGYSPANYLRQRRRLWDENPEQSQQLGQLPID